MKPPLLLIQKSATATPAPEVLLQPAPPMKRQGFRLQIDFLESCRRWEPISSWSWLPFDLGTKFSKISVKEVTNISTDPRNIADMQWCTSVLISLWFQVFRHLRSLLSCLGRSVLPFLARPCWQLTPDTSPIFPFKFVTVCPNVIQSLCKGRSGNWLDKLEPLQAMCHVQSTIPSGIYGRATSSGVLLRIACRSGWLAQQHQQWHVISHNSVKTRTSWTVSVAFLPLKCWQNSGMHHQGKRGCTFIQSRWSRQC